MSDKLKILAVDDEKDNLDLLKRALRKDYEVFSSTSPQEALVLLEDHDFHVILSDQRMPDMAGTEFLAQSLERQPSAIRILITGYSDIDAVIDAINKGSIHRFIKKPWRKEELIREIHTTEKLLTLMLENRQMVKALKKANDQLERQKELLAKDLDDRTKDLYRANEELKKLNEQLKGQSLRDGLTNLYNHKAFQQRLREEVYRSLRNNDKLSLIFIDVDHFKNFNDVHGHQAGDDLLRLIAALLASSSRSHNAHVRGSDVVARYGGEEFALILPETPLEGAKIKAQRIRKAIEEQKVEGMESQPLKKITVSVGISTLPDDAETPETLIEHADQAMYAAKHSGRNQALAYKEIKDKEEKD